MTTASNGRQTASGTMWIEYPHRQRPFFTNLHRVRIDAPRIRRRASASVAAESIQCLLLIIIFLLSVSLVGSFAFGLKDSDNRLNLRLNPSQQKSASSWHYRALPQNSLQPSSTTHQHQCSQKNILGHTGRMMQLPLRAKTPTIQHDFRSNF